MSVKQVGVGSRRVTTVITQTGTFTPPSWVSASTPLICDVTVIGAGGGGGGSATPQSGNGGNGGQALVVNGYAITGAVSATIGTGGAGGAAGGAGTAGGSTIFGSITAVGGTGGQVGTAQTATALMHGISAGGLGAKAKRYVHGQGGSTSWTYSNDGTNWVACTGASATLRDAAWGNDVYVVTTGSSSNVVYHSADGITWASATMPATLNWQSVAFGGGKFVAVGDSTQGAYSTDGTNWYSLTLPSNGYAYTKVVYANDLWIARTPNSGYYATSSDGISWTQQLDVSISDPLLAGGGGVWILLNASSTSTVYHSTDGVTWTSATINGGLQWNFATYGNGRFIVSGQVPGGVTTNVYATSTNGSTWTTGTFADSQRWQRGVYADGFIITSATTGSQYSADGVSWSTFTSVSAYGITAGRPIVAPSALIGTGALLTLTPSGGVGGNLAPSGDGGAGGNYTPPAPTTGATSTAATTGQTYGAGGGGGGAGSTSGAAGADGAVVITYWT